MEQSKKAILRTLLYSDLFDYPLTMEELWKYLMTKEKIEKTLFEKTIGSLKQVHHNKQTVIYHNGFYCLSERKTIIQERLKRIHISKKKLDIARQIAKVLSVIPTVYCIGLSGSLSLENAQKDADIDFFIIARKNTLWITRLLVLLLLQVFGKRRKRNEKNSSDKVCLNMIIDASALALPKKQRNVYTAHEAIQMKPLFSRYNIYTEFITTNKWIEQIMPNALDKVSEVQSVPLRQQSEASKAAKNESIFNVLLHQLLQLVEPFAKRIQIWYINKHQSSEIVTDTLLAFYPMTYSKHILEAFKKKVSLYAL